MLATVIDADVDPIYLRDREGVCRMANSSLARLLGIPTQRIVGCRVSQFFPSESACAILEQEERAFAGETVQSCELTLKTPQGDRPFLVTHGIHRATSGEVAGVFGRLRDASHQKRLESEVVAIAEHVMRRIAADLHDDLCQELAAVSLISRLLQNKLADDDSGKIACHIADLTKKLATSTRDLVHNLDPLHLSGENFIERLRNIAANVCAAYPLQCGIEGTWPAQVTGSEVPLHLYRIIHEAMHNAAKHSGGSYITVRLRAAEETFTVMISDNGRGLPPDLRETEGIGLNTMRYRAALCGGVLKIESTPDCGTTVICRFPLKKRAPASALKA